MREILFQYESVNPTTWAYLSSLLVIGLYFKFNRVWSVRNLDILLILALSPGLLMVYFGQQSINRATSIPALPAETAPLIPPLDAEADKPPPVQAVAALGEEATEGPSRQELLQIGKTLEKAGYIWLFCLSGLIVIRLFVDPTMVRRPMLEPNLTIGGMTFITCALFIFLMTNVIVGRPSDADLRGVREASKSSPDEVEESLRHFGPGYRMLLLVPRIPTYQLAQQGEPTDLETTEKITVIVTKSMAILANMALIAGIILVGYRHFDNIKMGIGAAMFYFLLPYAAVYTGRIDHVLPAALLVWAIFFYRTPLVSGVFMGFAIGTLYYPLFLLPLWFSYYWERGRARFLIGVLSTLLVLTLSLAFTSSDFDMFLNQFRAMFGLWLPRDEGYTGFWNYYFNSNAYRIPVLAAFAVISIAFAIWPAQKNLGTLLSCTAGLMLAAQFWHANDGTTYIAWYMPLMLLTIFRPNLEDRVALRVIGEGWLKRNRQGTSPTDSEKQAA